MKKTVLSLLLAASMIPAVANAQVGVTVRVGPPPPVVEHYGRPPHEGWVWQPGYHRWDGNRYVWQGGVWAEPPHRHAHWVAGHWAHHHDGYVFVEGHWR